MAMVVTCGSCGARFRVKEALLKDAAGARIRCRRCGGHIDVWKPGAFPPPPAPVAPARIPDEPAFPPAPEGAETEPETAPWEAPGPGPATEPEPEPFEATRVPAGEEEPAEEKAGVPAFDLTATVPVPAPGPGFSREPREVDRNALRRESRLSRRRRARFAVYLVAACILLLAGGAFYLRDTPFGKAVADKLRNTVPVRELVRRIFPPPEPAKTAAPAIPVAPVPAAEKPAYEFRDVKSYHVKKALNGADLFVIEGTVANFGKVRSPGIRIRAALLGRDNEVLASTSVFAGNHLDNTALRHASRAVIEGYLGVRYGEGNVNRDIPVGNSLPFMAVLFDPPQQFQSFEVNAQDAE